MSKKDFELIADAIFECEGDLDYLIHILCRKLKEDNPLFDAAKFKRVCQFGG